MLQVIHFYFLLSFRSSLKEVLNMLLKRRVKAQQEIYKWISRRIVIILNLSVHLYGFASLQCKNKLS